MHFTIKDIQQTKYKPGVVLDPFGRMKVNTNKEGKDPTNNKGIPFINLCIMLNWQSPLRDFQHVFTDNITFLELLTFKNDNSFTSRLRASDR